MALALPKLALNRKQVLTIVGGVAVAAAAGWAGMQYFEETPPAPPPKPVTQTKPAGAAKAAAPSPDKLIADLIAASGLSQHLEQLPQQLIAGVKQSSTQQPKTSPAFLAAIEKAVTESFTAQKFQTRLNADLKTNFDQKRVQTLLTDYAAPATKSMVALEQASSSPEELTRFMRAQSASRLPPARAELIKRIDSATKAGDLAVEAAFASMTAITAGIVGEQAKKVDAVGKMIEKQRASTTASIRSSTFANLAFAYRNASDADLESYAKFYETENSNWFSGLVFASLLEEAKSAAAQTGEQVGALTRKAGKPAKPGAPALPEATPVRTKAASEPRSKSGGDARACLELNSDAVIIKCAEKFR